MSTFVPTDKCPKGSFNYYRNCLGYLEGEVISHYNDECYFIALNAFNNEIIFIIPKDTTKTALTQDEAKKLLGDFSIDEGTFTRNLDEGIKDKSIGQAFVEKSLGIKAVNNVLEDSLHGCTYTFKEGHLVEYKSHDGLTYEAKDIKSNHPQIFSRIESNAKLHYGTSPPLMAEYINGQCKYLRRIDMNYLRMAASSNINYNYALLYCVLYDGVSLDEFSFLVPGATLTSSVTNYIIMSYGHYVFTFRDKKLVKM